MSTTLAYTGTLHILTCGVCQIPHAIPVEMYRDRSDNGGNWWCPNGHKLHFITTERDKLERELAAAKRSRDWAQVRARAAHDQAAAAERTARALRGWNTRYRNKIAAGVCPVDGCRRHFSDVQAHIATKHPRWVDEHPEALS